MKNRSKKVLSTWIILVIIAVGGCASQTPYKPPPTMPSFTTDQQKVCGRGCQAVYACCKRACIDERGWSGSASDHSVCLDNCDTSVEQCYQTCK